MKKVLYIDDDPGDCEAVRAILYGRRICFAKDGRSGLEAVFREEPDLVILDLLLPDMNGFEVLDRLALLGGKMPEVVVLSGTTDPEARREARRRPRVSFLRKPVEPDILRRSVSELLDEDFMKKRPRQEEIRPAEPDPAEGCSAILGSGDAMRKLRKMLPAYAASGLPVLIMGESGTGKELFAAALHDYSGRKAFPFVPFNCAALPEALAESELFGTSAGAFTGAVSRPGLFDRAHTGTLFLDEIAELPLSCQAKLLRVLETGLVERLGGGTGRKVDVRLVSATNRNLSRDMDGKLFRKDLFFRIAHLEIVIPPLRERKDDIGELACAFLERHGYGPDGYPLYRLSSGAEVALERYSWPGNVRELQMVLQRAMIGVGRSGTIRASDLDLPVSARGGDESQLSLF